MEEEKSNQLDFVNEKIRINLWLSRKLFNGVQDVCREEEKSLSDVVRDALKLYIKKQKTKPR